MGYLYLFAAISATIISQLLIKWRIQQLFSSNTQVANTLITKLQNLVSIILDPIVIVAMLFTFVGGILWILTLSKFEISYAYPFTMLGFVAVLALSALILGETLNSYKIAGCLIIIIGVIVSSKGI